MSTSVIIRIALITKVENGELFQRFLDHLKSYKQAKWMEFVQAYRPKDLDYDITDLTDDKQFKKAAKSLIGQAEKLRFKKILTEAEQAKKRR